MTRFERRWARVVLEAFAPPGGPGLSPRPGEVDYVGAFEHMVRASTWKAAVGTRLALWIAALAPMWMWRRPCTAVRLGLGRRTELLRALSVHPVRLVRELMLLLKLGACFALLGHPSVRARSGYDRGVVSAWSADGDEAWESGTRRRRLPVVGEAGAVEVG